MITNETQILFFQTPGSLILSGLFSWISIIISCHQIALHAKHYTNPDQQTYIIRILLIVPIYSLDSWFSLVFFQKNYYIYFDTIRDCYEAFVIYNFLCLCFEYLGGEMAILSEIRGRPLKTSYLMCTCCLSGKVLNIEFLRFCKKAAIQFCIMKPVMAALILVLEGTGNYGDGDFRPDRGYLYITLLYNFSYSVALYGMFLFYSATKDLLSPFYPVLKFITVKFVIFMSFWQGLVLTILDRNGLIGNKNQHGVKIAAGYQNFILCIEMFFAAVMMKFAFPHIIYRIQKHKTTGRNALKTISKNLRNSINPKDIVMDTIHNFSPAYQHYAGVNRSVNVESSIRNDGKETVSYQVTLPDRQTSIRDSTIPNNYSYEHGHTPLLLDTDDDT
ncbi:transmembrane protein 184A isoform X1 [Hydra vulgaris]|nr:transmembrane protein 184A [Hydra vulgaris]